MDELMARFVTNMERQDCQDRFAHGKERIVKKNIHHLREEEIEADIKSSMTALRDLLANNTIDVERQPNSENQLYLKLMERAQEENRLELINLVSSKVNYVIHTQKPKHLKN